MFRPLAPLMALTLLAAAPAAAQEPAEPTRRIRVEGRGEASATPDLARLRIGVTARAPDAAEAARAASRRAEAVIAALREAGIEGQDLQTAEIALHPVRNRPEPGQAATIEGYEARNALSVTLRALDRLGEVIDAAVAAGADDLGAVRFDLSERDAILAEARRAAVADAEAAARLLAEAAGVGLGPLLDLSLGAAGVPAPRFAMRAEMAADASTPVEPGALTAEAVVSAVYAME